MEPKKFKTKFKFYENNGGEETNKYAHICNFKSCDYCQGRPLGTFKKENTIPLKKKKYNPNAREKICAYRECKYCQKIIRKIDQERTDYYLNYAIEERNKEIELQTSIKNQNSKFLSEHDIEMTDETETKNALFSIDILNNDSNKILEVLKKLNTDEIPKIKVKGDGSCLYRAILVSLGEDEKKFMELRENLSKLIEISEIEEDLILVRNCKNIQEFAEKVKNRNFYADHIEIYFLSKLLNIIIAIYNENKNKWDLIKHDEVIKPSEIAYIIFKESSYENANHYDAFLIKRENKFKISTYQPYKYKKAYQEEKLQTLIWNVRSLNDVTKRLYLADIISNNTPDIVILLETFLLDDFNLYIRNYKTYKTRNIIKRKGIAILIHKNIIASITQIANDVNGRYIKLSLNSGQGKTYTLSGIYLEPNGNNDVIPEEIYESDVIIGDLNNFESGLDKYNVYHYKNIKINSEIIVNNKISDHNILKGEMNIILKRTEIFSNIDVNDRKIIEINNLTLKEALNKEIMNKLFNPHKIIKINNYKNNPKDLNRYNEWEKIKEYNKKQYDTKYDRINKIISSGAIDDDTWTQLNKMFINNGKKEIYNGDHMKNEIIAFYEELYQSKEQRKELSNKEFLDKIATIIQILLNQNYSNEDPIWKPKSESLDYNGFSQKEIEKIIREKNLQEEILKFKNLLAKNCSAEGNAEIFIHRTSRTILFKKKSNIRGGTDIRIINILPAWLIILEKLAQVKIKNILTPKLSNFQFGFRERSDCNLAKILVWYNNSKLGYNKHLLIDIQKAFDSINRQKLKEMIVNDFEGEDKEIIIDFLDIYENINYNILGKILHPTKGGPQGSSLVPMLFCYYIEKAINNKILN